MKCLKERNMIIRKQPLRIALLLLLCIFSTLTGAQQSFPSPEQSFQTLADASKAGDEKKLAILLGPGSYSLIHSGDATEDRQDREKFAASYAEKHSVIRDGDAKATLVIGNDDWP